MVCLRDNISNKITVATLDGKSYYKIINILKTLQIDYEELSPLDAQRTDSKIIITSKKESNVFKKRNIMLDSDLSDNLIIVKAKIIRKFMQTHIYDQLVIGIDPGSRIGISIFYYYNEVDSIVLSSEKSTIDFIYQILSSINSKKKIIRIGNGDMNMAKNIAYYLKNKFKDLIHIEIVDEYGTSNKNIGRNRRGIKDKSAARSIAFRNGKTYKLYDDNTIRNIKMMK
ncbi:MAG: hypothetical protein ACPKPY_03385 [Nitrososphaeraceae archaeon]